MDDDALRREIEQAYAEQAARIQALDDTRELFYEIARRYAGTREGNKIANRASKIALQVYDLVGMLKDRS